MMTKHDVNRKRLGPVSTWRERRKKIPRSRLCNICGASFSQRSFYDRFCDDCKGGSSRYRYADAVNYL
jgi:hypothetical protein